MSGKGTGIDQSPALSGRTGQTGSGMAVCSRRGLFDGVVELLYNMSRLTVWWDIWCTCTILPCPKEQVHKHGS